MSSGGGQQTSTTRVEYSPEETAFRNSLMADSLAEFNKDWQNGAAQTYTGPKPVGASNATQQSWNAGMLGAGQTQNDTAQARAANSILENAPNVSSNPYLAQAMMAANRPLIDTFTSAGGPLSTIRNTAVGNGSYGGSRQGIAEGLAMKGLQQQISDTDAKMASDAYYKGLDAANQGVANTAKLAMLNMIPSQVLSSIGQQQEGYQQAANNYDSNVATARVWQPFQLLQNAAGIANANTSAAQNTTSSIPRQNNTGQLLGSLGTLGLIMAMMP